MLCCNRGMWGECGLQELFCVSEIETCRVWAAALNLVLVRCGCVVFGLFATLYYCACFPVGLWHFSFPVFLLRWPDFRAGGKWDHGCRSKNQYLCKQQHFTSDECIHQVKGSSTEQVNLPVYYSSELQMCCVINAARENARREELSLYHCC